ncbi:hypothetical protein I553_5872 [Mycobacterium xenopi 4042]|uniref:Rv3651-like N-terminal domain-containing protein n=1 Tax=Mycobacterium xenopi 4042 TaxID=1299334 RepID=X7ZYD5_MYCXE|nr:hypothetical protein I553_5872 [Mycobacterium xenopi 4042]
MPNLRHGATNGRTTRSVPNPDGFGRSSKIPGQHTARNSSTKVAGPQTCLDELNGADNRAGRRKVAGMGHDWLLVETLGKEPIVVAQGTQPRNLVPITAFLRRNPHLAAIRTAIAESIRTGRAGSKSKTRRLPD